MVNGRLWSRIILFSEILARGFENIDRGVKECYWVIPETVMVHEYNENKLAELKNLVLLIMIEHKSNVAKIAVNEKSILFRKITKTYNMLRSYDKV